MQKKLVNTAYIDGANLHNGVQEFNWKLDYQRFNTWLREKYAIKQAYIFIGLIPKYKELYTYLQECGFTLVFKEVTYDGSGKPKGNCDADLVLKAVQDAYESNFERAVIISSDGDYAGLVSFLSARQKLLTVLSPSSEKKCSILLKRTNAPIAYLHEKRSILEKRNEKAPDADGTA
ncbi:MAG TPA: NYN domain-containing protein [Candidatus Paceibacterota bacterium]|nr:NYN domain-containing protein [Candidatus Paceibacterota bacterium]